MVISHEHEYLFISNPKTGTHTMYYYLPLLYDGKRIGEMHEHVAPDGVDNYCVFTTIREPFDRTVAVWNSLFAEEREYDVFIDLVGATDFPSFVDFLTSYDNNSIIPTERAGPALTLQSTWLQPNLDKLDFCLRTDNLNDDFSKLPFATGSDVFEAKLQRNHPAWVELKEELTSRQKGKLIDWLAPDIELWENI